MSTDEKDPASYPVLIVPGYGTPGFQTDLVGRKLRAAGLDTVGIKLPWMAMGDMVRSADVLAEQVRRVMEYRGFEKVNLMGFSLGGLVARYYLQEMEGHPHLSRCAFVSSPNSGTYFGYIGFFSPAGRQVRPGSSFIEALNSSPLYESISGRCLSIFVRWDGVILPCFSSYMPHGYNLLLPRPISHWRAVMSDETLSRASEFLGGGMPEGALPGRELGMMEEGGRLAVTFAPPPRRRYWSVVSRPFRSFFRRVLSAFKR
jgi:pimeloyl-ACP methyl ester carboxylesterase